MSSMNQQMRQAIAAVESTPPAASTFATRAEAIEFLEVHVLTRLQYIQQERVGLPADLQALQLQAASLHRRLEAANQSIVERLRSRIRAGRYTPAGLKRALTRCAGPLRDPSYDALDLLMAGLMDAGTLPEERAVLEPEMVAYQPTPGRVILSLLDRADIAPTDVVYDLGSGLGWVVILVGLLSGARVKGIEIEPAYCEYAAYCARRLNASSVEFIQADARDARLDAGGVFFMYTPFRGALLQRVLERLRMEATQRRIRVCTYGPCTVEVARASWLTPRNGADLNQHEVAVFDSVQISK